MILLKEGNDEKVESPIDDRDDLFLCGPDAIDRHSSMPKM